MPHSRDAALLIAAEAVTLAPQFSIFFILQRRGGPIYVSLLGAVAATIGVPLAILLLGKAAPTGLEVGVTLIVIGIAVVTRQGAKDGPGTLPERSAANDAP